jgi:hypothetical protein
LEGLQSTNLLWVLDELAVIRKYLIARTAEQALVPTKHSETSCPATSSSHAFRSICLKTVKGLLYAGMGSSWTSFSALLSDAPQMYGHFTTIKTAPPFLEV